MAIRFVTLLLAVLFAVLAAACAPVSEVEVSEAWVRKPVAGLDRTAGYFRVHNHTPEEIVLTAARSSAVRAIEFHTTVERDGMLRMRRLDTVAVPAGEAVEFSPGGKHLMLFGVAATDEPLVITLETAAGQTYEVTFPVLDNK